MIEAYTSFRYYLIELLGPEGYVKCSAWCEDTQKRLHVWKKDIPVMAKVYRSLVATNRRPDNSDPLTSGTKMLEDDWGEEFRDHRVRIIRKDIAVAAGKISAISGTQYGTVVEYSDLPDFPK